MRKLRVVVAGAGGKMGQSLIEGVLADKALELAGAKLVGNGDRRHAALRSTALERWRKRLIRSPS